VVKIKVLFIHNFYQQPGGEDKVVASEMELLKSKGIEVNLFSAHNNTINNQNVFGKIKIALETIWSYTYYKKIKKYLTINKPDVVHVHNFFPLISPSVYYACSALNIPVVQTLHNYRIICPSATLLLNNQICEISLKGSMLNSIRYGLYHNSKLHTVPVASMISINRLLGTWNDKVSRYIALTNFAKGKFIEGGISSNKITVKPNFIKKKNIEKGLEDKKFILYVGRISIEKGLHILLKAWKNVKNKQNYKLIIIGDGPEKARLEKEYELSDIIFMGKQNENIVLEYMRSAKYLIVPSIWYEGFPMSIVESYSMGTPVICTNIGSLQEVVDHEKTGFHFKYNDFSNLSIVLERALYFTDYNKMRRDVLKKYHENYTPEVNYKKLINIYQEVIKEKNNGTKTKY
jgi:glycosyltransferase involved in cell wall biosynthesis